MKNFDVEPRTDYLGIDPHGTTFGLYCEDEYRPAANLGLTLGLRYDHYDTFGCTLNPRLACVYSPVGATTLKLLAGTAFRAPNANEFYYDDDGLSSKVNPGLKPEKISTCELVCEQQLGGNWRGSAAGFYSHVSNLIEQAQDPVDSLYYSANLDKVDAHGVEFQLDGQVTGRIRARASFTFTRTRDNATGEPLDNSPARLGKLNLTAPVLRNWLFLGGEAQYVSRRTVVGAQTLGDQWLLNATLFSRQLRGSYGFSLSVYNVFGTHYFDPSAGSPNAVERDGRTLRAKVTARF